ncbi:MAG: hypothetical protein IT259_01185 [Saprospiraceae bacterium]|nr:hypothetical protein [Saprospiraceae bacterium]
MSISNPQQAIQQKEKAADHFVPPARPNPWIMAWQTITDWERWPFAVFYFPLSFVWLWHILRARAFWFFSPSNPTLTFGGFEGEGKKEMYEQLPPDSFPATLFIQPDEDFEGVLEKIKEKGLKWPFIVKPDIGMKSLFFRKIDTPEQLLEYHRHCPVEYLAQDLIPYPMEVGVFYVRHPKEKKGRVTGMVQKDPPKVTGNGASTLRELIAEHPRARFRFEEMCRKHAHALDQVIPDGEEYYLSYAGSRNRGAQIVNLSHLIDDRLSEVFDRFSHHNGQFFYGRYDVKCTHVDDLREGRNFSIIEFNGCGSGVTHIFHNGWHVFRAYAEIIRHWKHLSEISLYNNKVHKVPYWSFWRGLQHLRQSGRHFKWLEQHDY